MAALFAPTAAARFDARLLAEATALGASAARFPPRGRRPRDSAIGDHGRRRAGPGAAFWQYRPYTEGEPARLIDWRRTAREDRPIVREREWEAMLTLSLWVDASASMAYPATGGPASKRRVADLLALAAASAWLKNGGRIQALGDGKGRGAAKLAGVVAGLMRAGDRAAADDMEASLPPQSRAPRDGFVLLIGDFMAPPAATIARAAALAASGARGAAIQVLHGDEAGLDFGGRVEFASIEANESHLLRHVESGRDRYLDQLEAHNAALAAGLARIGWALTRHRTDRPHGPPLIAALAALAAGG